MFSSVAMLLQQTNEPANLSSVSRPLSWRGWGCQRNSILIKRAAEAVLKLTPGLKTEEVVRCGGWRGGVYCRWTAEYCRRYYSPPHTARIVLRDLALDGILIISPRRCCYDALSPWSCSSTVRVVISSTDAQFVLLLCLRNRSDFAHQYLFSSHNILISTPSLLCLSTDFPKMRFFQ